MRGMTSSLDRLDAEQRTRRLAALLAAAAPHDGVHALRSPGVYAIRASQPSLEHVHGLHRPHVCIVAQGCKTVLVNTEAYDYDAARMLIFSVDLPVAAQVRLASAEQPYLCFKLLLDPARVAELVGKVYPAGVPTVDERRGVFLAQANEAVIDAAERLLELHGQEDDAGLIAPLIVDEIIIRLLRSPVGGRLAQIGSADSHVRRIGKAVAWVKEHFAEPMRIDMLAAMVHMSSSTFHQHFKAVTSMSPLQYQKVLRLQEARRLMLARGLDASLAGQQVGYRSASQFSREYARLFGEAPLRDRVRLRNVPLESLSFSQ